MAVTFPRITSGILIILLYYLRFTSPVSGLSSNDVKISPYIASQRSLWRHNEADVAIYRIPLLTYTPGGRLLTVTEARKYAGGDAGPKFMAIRRSEDALGDKWEAMQLIQDDGYLVFDGLNLGNVIVDDEKGIIFIMFTVCNHHDRCSVTSTKLIRSVDDGVTWSRPVNVSEQVGTRVFSPGPGFGFQKKYAPSKGRLVSCGHGGGNEDGVYCLLSDDHGATWRWGASLEGMPYNGKKEQGDFVPDECQAVELSDGSIMVNIRNQYHYNCHCRMMAYSYDGGETLPVKDVHMDKTLIEPACAAGMLYHRDIVFFTNPNNSLHRVDLTLRWSYDNGTTWASELQIWDKASGYSTMTAHPGSSQYIFILFEKGILSTTESVQFVRINLYN